MSSAVYIAIAVVVVLVIIAAVIASRRRRSGQLQGAFGPEYDRTVEATGDRGAAEKELAGRVNRHKQFSIVPLTGSARQQYAAEWQQVQTGFVDAPAQSVQQADALVARVMTERGYPMAEFDQRASDISVDHPHVVENYRAAHAICLNGAQDRASTEDLRQAMTHYRALFEELLGADAGAERSTETQLRGEPNRSGMGSAGAVSAESQSSPDAAEVPAGTPVEDR